MKRDNPPYALGEVATYRGITVTIISRAFVSSEWLYGVRLDGGKTLDFIPGRLLKAVAS